MPVMLYTTQKNCQGIGGDGLAFSTIHDPFVWGSKGNSIYTKELSSSIFWLKDYTHCSYIMSVIKINFTVSGISVQYNLAVFKFGTQAAWQPSPPPPPVTR